LITMPNMIPEPVRAVLATVYDVVIELGEETKDPGGFHHRFFGELTRVELAMLKKKADMALPVYRHPLPAMKTYRSFMCGASIYDGMGDAKLRLRDYDTFEIRYWHCPYAVICEERTTKICIRTHSLSEAADLMSPTTFNEIEDLRFVEEGNCIVFVRMHFTGDIREIDTEDRVIDERPCLHLTREEAEIFMLRSLMVGTEYACNHLPEVNVRHTLRQIAEGIEKAKLDDKYLHEFPFLKRGLKYWSKGKNAFTRHD
jgi:hypothetical protein